MELHKKVANFTLQDQDEKTVSLTDFAGKPVVLFFYPKADTPGCTIEACGFRDTFVKLTKACRGARHLPRHPEVSKEVQG